MKFVVIEIQKNLQGVISTLPYAFDEKKDAEAKYHQILSAAALTTLPCHAAVMLREDGIYLKSEAYSANVEPEEE